MIRLAFVFGPLQNTNRSGACNTESLSRGRTSYVIGSRQCRIAYVAELRYPPFYKKAAILK